MRGGPCALRARSIASGTPSSPTILPTLGSGSSRPSSDRVEGAVPVVGERPAAELDGHALVRRLRAVEGVAGVPAAGGEDARAHVARLDDVLEQPRGADALEDHRRARDTALGRKLVADVEGRALARVHEDVRAERRRELEALRFVVGRDHGLDATGGQGGDRGESDRAGADHDRDLARRDA